MATTFHINQCMGRRPLADMLHEVTTVRYDGVRKLPLLNAPCETDEAGETFCYCLHMTVYELHAASCLHMTEAAAAVRVCQGSPE
jgi:hypothetical protein